MKAVVEQRARIAKIRIIEKRVAAFALARADRELNHVENIVERLAALGNDLNTGAGANSGASLAAISETRMRLANAGRAAAVPLLDAATRRDERHASAITANRKADGADAMFRQSSVNAAKKEAIRADANRISRRVAISGSDS
jgi:hypothetical protein